MAPHRLVSSAFTICCCLVAAASFTSGSLIYVMRHLNIDLGVLGSNGPSFFHATSMSLLFSVVWQENSKARYLLCAFWAGVSIILECFQDLGPGFTILSNGTFDYSDIVASTLGLIAGLLIFAILLGGKINEGAP